MHTLESRDNWAFISDDYSTMLAEVGPTFLKQPKHVLLYPSCTNEQREEVIAFAARQVTRRASWEYDMTPADLLKERGIEVVSLDYETSAEAIAAAVDLAGVPGLRATLGDIPWCDERKVRFRVGRANRFEFWKSVSIPEDRNGMWALHVVPGYHPSVTGGKEYGLINGCTDCNISDTVVKYVMCPRASVVAGIKHRGSTWSHVKHPFVAVGRTLDMRVSEHHVRTTKGVESLAAYLRAALRLDGRYIGISGGFHAPLEHPANYLRVPYASCRGSEQACVWEYRVLQREGQLEGAFVPKWLHEEKWLQKYENAVERHGSF